METNMNEDFDKIIDSAFNEVLTETQANTNQAGASPPFYANPEEYHKNTNRRFRMAKDEIERYGKTDEGRLNAFLAI